MSHEIDMSNNRANIAFVGETPWHDLGRRLTPGASIEEWTREAGLQWEATKAPVQFERPLQPEELAHDRALLADTPDSAVTLVQMPGRNVLYRSDNGAPLSVVSDDYKVVQPAQIMDFFAKLADIGGFDLEVAGALSGGRRVWALAKIGDGAPVVDKDIVKPYLLLGTSYDGTMTTIAKFTAIRVVCNNTITAAIDRGFDEVDKGYLKSVIRVVHSEDFNADAVRLQLGIAANQWERFLIASRQLAAQPMKAEQADAFVQEILKPYYRKAEDIKETRAYKRVIELFNGAAIGSDIPGVAGTKWGMLNAVTELIDHERGKSENSRLESAWFGTGARIKARAMELLAA